MEEEARALLEQIRDLQREHLAEYKRVSERSLALQERAVARQEQMGRLYRGVVTAVALVVLATVLFSWYEVAR